MTQYIIVGIILTLAVVYAIIRLVRRSKGDTDCGCGCGKNCKNR